MIDRLCRSLSPLIFKLSAPLLAWHYFLLTATLLIARTAAWPQVHGPRSLFNSALGIGKHGLANWPQGETEW